MDFHICRADKKRNKLQVRGRLWNGRITKFPAHKDARIAEQIRRNIQMLNEARVFGQLPPVSLAPWIAGLDPKDAARFIQHGLLDRKVLDKDKPLEEFFPAFESHLQASERLKNGSSTPVRRVAALRRLLDSVKPHAKLADINLDSIVATSKKLLALSNFRKGKQIAQKTRRGYLSDAKGFFEWMVDEGSIVSNPLRKLKLPSAKGDPVLRRAPMTTENFITLSDYLIDAPDRYKKQIFDWSPIDRLMIYWTAVITGFRSNELRSLTRSHFDFKSVPARVTVDGWVAKNGNRATIPLAEDFADALRDYSAHFHPLAPLLRMQGKGGMLKALYRDLDAAGVRRDFDNGSTVDFHTLRSTAIFWWVTKSKLHLLDVQLMARLKTLSLIQDYVDDYAPDFHAIVENSPRVVDAELPFKRAS